MFYFGWLSLFGAESSSPLPLDSSSILVAIISVVGTFGAAWLMFRGKTQDTANWLIVELRNQAKAAMDSAIDCEQKRMEDHQSIQELRGMVAGLQGGVRRLTRENSELREEIDRLKEDQLEC